MKQSRISAAETPGAVNFNLETLVRLAAALKVGLVVKFVSFSEMLKWENGYDQDAFDPLTIDKDADFQRKESPAVTPAPNFQSVLGVGTFTSGKSHSFIEAIIRGGMEGTVNVAASIATSHGVVRGIVQNLEDMGAIGMAALPTQVVKGAQIDGRREAA
jgi:hypothetical protein